jgi:hypothetical protein
MSYLPTTLAWPPVALAGGCVPGQDGIPDSSIGGLLCGGYATDAPGAIVELVRDRWPWLLAAVLAVLVGWLTSAGLRRRAWRSHAAKARWVAVTPPVTATPQATIGLWRLLATLLPAPRWWQPLPPRIVWEIQATARSVRCGLWLPPGVNPTAVTRMLHRAWPGARTEQTRPPGLDSRWPVVTLAVQPTRPDWLPLIDEPDPAGGRRWGQHVEDDRLRAVFDGLAAAGRTGSGLLQIHVCRAHWHRMSALRRASIHPGHFRRARGVARIAAVLADALRAIVIAGLDLLTPGTSGHSRVKERRDPGTADLARQARAKLATPPHLLVAVHATASGPTRGAAKAAADDITGGFGLLSARFTRCKIRRSRTAARWRWVPASRMHLATVVEVAALAGLPAEPAAYGLPAAAARRRPASTDTWSTP